MHWSEFQERQPRLADLGRRRLIEPGVLLVSTIRSDGTPRLSPVEPYLLDGMLWLSMMWGSLKAQDLVRDTRILLHSVVTSPAGTEGEFKLRGRAEPEQDVELQRRYASAVAEDLGWRPEPGWFHLFAVDISHSAFVRYDKGTGDQYVVTWPPGNEYVRRAVSATAVGAPEPVQDLLT